MIETSESNTRALITGAASGIGRGLALHLATRGAGLGLIDIDGARLSSVADHARQLGAQVDTQVLDVGHLDHLREAVTLLADELGRIDLCAPMAGVLIDGHCDDLTPDSWELAFRINTTHAVAAATTALSWSRSNATPCHVLLAGSDSSLRPQSGMGPYAASKAALASFALTLNEELADESDLGVTLGLIFPTKSELGRSSRSYLHDSTPRLDRLDSYLASEGDETATVVARLLDGVHRGEVVVNTDRDPTRRRRISYRAATFMRRLLPPGLAALATPPRSGGQAVHVPPLVTGNRPEAKPVTRPEPPPRTPSEGPPEYPRPLNRSTG